ncbi:NAD(P)/FAD-dependent oxidoreductase [Novosphingobium terrae]|uniref:NAD(P)/FAD-dependent oxidoreductase n=1 Tax=Novosphingobium terrae TaxID=2726189 RepID=UPI001980ECDB|nr:FAD/NAD(P)-binding oxidoreductase [Novosphingobium terrae]
MAQYDVLIVGAGHGGAQAAIALRKNGFAGTIGLVGAELELPYERPPLSKEYLAGEKAFERLLIRQKSFWDQKAIELRLGQAVIAVNPGNRTVGLRDGVTIGFGDLVWAAGGTPRQLQCDGHHLGGLHYMRTRADADALERRLPAAERIVIVGGGYIGLEAAAVMRKLGKAVTLIETADRVLARVAGEPLSRFFERLHRAHGVDIRLNASVNGLVGRQGQIEAVRLADGEMLPADLVIAGVGIVPAVEPLVTAGATASAGGLWVDAGMKTSLDHVYAIGDCAAHSNLHAGHDEPIRLESVQNANDQAVVAARNICGIETFYDARPWFWSHQYDTRLQTIGLAAGFDAMLLRGDPDSGSFSVIYGRGGRVVALDCVNNTKDYVQGRGLVEAGALMSAALADASVPFKALNGADQ